MNDLLSINRWQKWAASFANIQVETALTQINNAYPFPCAALFIFSPYKEPNICRKIPHHLQEYDQLMSKAEKKKKLKFTLFLSALFEKLGINSNSAGIYSTTSLRRFRPLGKEIMKLIKFQTSFITSCFLPFANLSKSSALYPTGKNTC